MDLTKAMERERERAPCGDAKEEASPMRKTSWSHTTTGCADDGATVASLTTVETIAGRKRLAVGDNGDNSLPMVGNC